MIASRNNFATKGPPSFSVVEIKPNWIPPTLSCPDVLHTDEDQEVGIESAIVNDDESYITSDEHFQQKILSLKIATARGVVVRLQTWPSGIFPDPLMIEKGATNMHAASDELLFYGFLNDINSALLQLRYKGPKNVLGEEVDEITISLYQGIDMFGAAPLLIRSCSIAAHLSSVNDPPQVSNPLPLAPSSAYNVESGGQRWGWVTVEGLSVFDVDDETLHVRLSAICEGCIAELWLPLNIPGTGKLNLTTWWPENEEEEEENRSALSGSVIEVEGSITDINLALSAMLFSGPPSLGTGITVQVQDKAGASSFLFIPHELTTAEEIIGKNVPTIHAASVGDGGSLQSSSHFMEIVQGDTLSLGSAAGFVVDNGMSSQNETVAALQSMATMRALVQFRHGVLLEIQSIVTSTTSTDRLSGSFSISIGAEEVLPPPPWFSCNPIVLTFRFIALLQHRDVSDTSFISRLGILYRSMQQR